jgi:hypothetical protein
MLGDLVKSEQAGFGGLCGICVVRDSGDVLINLSDRGFYRSADGARSFQRLGETQPKGRTETPGCFLIDPTGKTKTMLTALVYGAPVSACEDAATWKPMHEKSAHVDWCAVDWTDHERKFVLALKHESGGLLIASRDGGRSFAEVGTGYGPGWIFDSTTAVVTLVKTKERSEPSLARTDDAGQTWKSCGDFSPVGNGSVQALPKWRDGILYWLVDGALIASSDTGKSWQTVCPLKGGHYGPVPGKTKEHFFVLTGDGVIETTNAGRAWSKAISVPPEVKGPGLTWLDYDPQGNQLYLMRMGSDLHKLQYAK